MVYTQPVTELIKRRFSCRTYLKQPIAADAQRHLADFMAAIPTGPLDSASRFTLVAATEQDRRSLKGLGTYGFIKDATGFIVGAVGTGAKNLEDYGYWMESIILKATELGLGTCWLGGSFTQSSFARKINITDGEIVPAVTSVGYIPDLEKARNSAFRRRLGADVRLPWTDLFFNRDFSRPLSPADAGAYAGPLEMVRLGPSASNKQPWRIVCTESAWHFYLQRTPNYGRGSLVFKILNLADLQRVDIGIAMSHFELTAREVGLSGEWFINEPDLPTPGSATEYVVSWRG